MGFSFFVHGDPIEVQLTPSAVRYELQGERDAQQRFVTETWHRVPLGGGDEARTLRPPDLGIVQRWRKPVFDSHAELFVLWRRHADGWLITVSLSNTQQVDEKWRNDPVKLERELNKLPKVEVPRVDPDAGKADGAALAVERLAAIVTARDEVCDGLDRFVAGYATWIEDQAQSIAELDTRYHRAAKNVVTGMRTAADRMRAGADLLRKDDTAARAFGLANEAMASQMRPSLRQRQPAGKPPETPRWRPFQLAFLLLTVASAIDEDADDRDLVDLIWFPTGGGKTEAYLGLMAFVIWWRRLRYKASGGTTTVLMRYTLRLLTKDQFRRAARLICAMELMRRRQPDILGAERITLGLWVGGASSPNTFEDAEKTLKEAIEDGQERPPSLLVLETCPWCGSAFTPRESFDAGAQHFRFRCTDADCDIRALEDALRKIDKGWPLYGETATHGQLREKEYKALTKPIPDQLEGEDFVTDHQTEVWRALELAPDESDGSRSRAIWRAVPQLAAVTRLREIRIFLGFSRVSEGFDDRIRPNSKGDTSEPVGRLVPPDLDGSQPWLPAIELYGEGILFTLDEAMLQPWERQDDLARRARTMQQRLENARTRLTEEPPSPITPRFILLHTLAHLLIRRLEAEAGYPAASIRERIYCAGGTQPMAGILTYVAVPDIAGSLGGVAELAQPRRFLRLLASVFDHADWCSLDPVCAEHEGQGPSQLNRAACHACTLIPEPSCQFGNLLLDRVFVAGDLRGEIQPLLIFARAE